MPFNSPLTFSFGSKHVYLSGGKHAVTNRQKLLCAQYSQLRLDSKWIGRQQHLVC